MPIGTSDGQYHEDEFQAAVAAPAFADDRAPLDQVTFNPMRKNWEQPGSDWVDEGSSFVNQAPSFIYDKIVAPTASKVYNAVVTKPLENIKNFTQAAMQMPLGASINDHPEVADAAAQTGLDLLGVGLTSAPMKAGLGIFGGRMSKTAVKAAELMENRGMSPEHVKVLTGLERGAEGMWRKEISDKDATISLNKFDKLTNEEGVKRGLEVTELENVLKHSEFFKAYPEAKNILVYRENEVFGNPKVYGQVFNDDAGQLHMVIKKGLSKEDTKETIIHELQHWVQHKEGFANSWPEVLPSEFKTEVKKDLVNKVLSKKEQEAVLSLDRRRNELPKDILEVANQRAKNTIEKLDDAIYRMQSSEAEAWNTAKRMNMSPSEIRRSLGRTTEEVPRSRQIIGDENGYTQYGSKF